MTRRALDYAGASGSMQFAAIAKLDSARFAAQVKVDGQYARVHLDRAGRISTGYSSTGSPLELGDLVGVLAGAPNAQLVGELTAHTEAGTRLAATLGYTQIHLFDCLHDGTRYLAREPYRVRRDTLCRMRAWVEDGNPDRPWYLDQHGDAHDPATGDYKKQIPRSWRRVPVIPQVPIGRAADLWERAIAGESEGIVVVALDAPLGKRYSKRKVKPLDHLDATVVQVDTACARLVWAGGSFVVGKGGYPDLAPGMVVSVRHNGYYEAGSQPRFARIASVRTDLA